MAVNKPVGDHAGKDAVKSERNADCRDGRAGLDEARQNVGRVYGVEKECQEIQGRQARKIMPRYHFDLIDSTTVAFEGGAEVLDDFMAMDVIETIARRLLEERPELKNHHYSSLGL